MRFALFTIVIVWAAAARAHGPCNYEVVAIIASEPCPPFGQLSTYGTAMNSQGDVAGFYLNCGLGYDAFFWSEDTGFVTLPRPAGVFNALAYGVNDNRIVCGEHQISGVGARGFVYDINNPGAGFTYLEPLHGVGSTYANAINNHNVVAGRRAIGKPGQSPNPFNAVIWKPYEPGSPVEDLGVMDGPNSWATSIADNGAVVGSLGNVIPSSGWVRIDEHVHILGPLPRGATSAAFAINESGNVAVGGRLKDNPDGLLTQGGIWHEFEWQMLPLLLGANSGGPTTMNDLGQAAGSAGFPPNPAANQRAVLWQHSTAFDLNPLVKPIDGTLHLTVARAMNNAGQVLVRGSYNGKVVAIVLSPVDRPLTDLNADCVTNLHDLLMLLDIWGPCGEGPCPADFNGDHKVDVLDLLILLDNWDMGDK
jgi:uncharacterized membrane protein